MVVVFITAYNGIMVSASVMGGFVWFEDWNNKYLCLFFKKKYLTLHLNGCENANGCGKWLQITVIPKHSAMSDFIMQQLYAHIPTAWAS